MNKFSLTWELTFIKVEVTAKDIIIILKILWEYPGDIYYGLDTWLVFHAFLIIVGISGFRPGYMICLPY